MMLLRFGRITGLRSVPLRKTQTLQFCDDKKISDSKNVEKETEKKPKIEKKESASEKLNKLLASMSTDDNLTLTKKVEIPQAGGRSKSKKSIKKEVEKEKKPKNLIEAAKGVADMLDAGADTHQKRKTESELLSKLLNHIDSDALTSETTVKSGTDFNLNNIIVGMKIDRKVAVQGDSDKRSTLTRSQYVKKALSGKRYEVDEEGRPRKPPRKHLTQPVPNSGSVNLFGEEALGIFKDPTNLKDSPDMLKTWSMLEERELKLAVTHPPRNYFEKMVLWTDQGKLWKFPIDNEQGLEKEQEVDFSEHVFLDQHLEGWCPTKGPIRHFMELVCIGLSKNPYISAQEKQEHIYWFKDYFEQKKELLKDLIQEKGQQEELEQKQIKTKPINSITSHQKELLGVHQQMSSRASLHTKSSKSTDKTKFDTKCGLKSNENKVDREIRFIGHSATWLPSEQGKVKTEDTVESNKKIVFVGHSATWIPTSPSKQRSTSFSTSAMQSAQSVQTEKHCKENVSEIKKKNLKSVKDNTLQTSTNIQTTKQKNNKEGSMKDETRVIKQNVNVKGTAKIVESNVVFDKDTNSLKIVTSGQSGQNQDSMTNKQNNILDAIKNFNIPEEVRDDIILSVPRYNLNKFITTIDPRSISDGIEMLVSEFEGNLETNKMKSNIQKTETVNSVKSNERAPVSTSKNITCSSKEQEKKITTLNSNIPEKVVVYDKPNNKLNVVSTKENPQVLEEAKRQDKTLDVLQAQAIADYALKHWLESDSANKILKEKPVTTNSKDPDLPMDLQIKIQEIREYSNKMTRFSSKLPETILNGKLTTSKTTANDLETTEMKTKLKNTSFKPEMVLNPGNEEAAKVITDKELVFMGNMCYWIPKSAQRDSKIIPKESKPQSTVLVDQQNKLFDSSGVLFKTPNFNSKRKNEVVIGENVLSRIVVIDNRKNPVDLWKPEVSTKPSCSSTVQNSYPITNTIDKKSINKENQGKANIIESFGVPAKYDKENIQLKETPVPLKNESKQQVTSKNQKSNLKSKPLFQAAQLEKHTEKYSNIENPTTTILKDGSIKKSFEPIKIVMNPIDLPKMTTTKTELKKEDSNKDKSIIKKVDKEKDELQKYEPLKSMQDKVKEDLNVNKISGPQKVNTSADSVKLKSPISKPLLKPQHSVTSTNIEQDNKSPVVEKVPVKPSKNLKSPVKSEKITFNNKENINFSVEANGVSTAPAANLEKKNSINTDIKTTVQIPNPEIIEKTKIDKEMKNVKEYKENLSNKPNIKNFDTVVKSSSAKIVTDQVVSKSKEHFRKETSFSNMWSQMEPKPQPTSSIAQPETEVKNNSKENLQLEKHTEKYSNIENPTTTILKDGSIKKSFEPIKIVMNPIDLPKITTTKTELKKEDSNKDKSIIKKADKEKDELQKHEPLKSMQDKVKEDLNVNKISGPQKVNTSADSVKLKSPISKPLLKPQHPVTSTNIEQDNKSPVVEKVPVKPSKNLKSPVKSEKITFNNKENINFSVEANAVSTAPAANLEKKNSINTDIKTTVQIPNPEIIEKTKIDKEMKNVKEYKENLSNKPNIKNFDTVVKSSSAKIVTDQVVSKSKEHFRKETSFSNMWSQMEPKPQPTSSIAQPETEVKNNSKENLNPKIKEEKPQKMPSVKNIEKSKHSVKQSTDANTPQRMTEVPDLKTPFKVKAPEFVKNTLVKESGKIATKSADQKDEILQKTSPPSSNSKISTTGFVIIEENPKKIEKEHELSKAEIKNFKTEMNKNPQTKVVESFGNSSFVLIENTDVTAKEKNVRGDNKNHEKILNSKMNKDEKPSQINKDPIILGPPKSKLNETKRPEFVLVNNASQTYSLAEPLTEKKSDTSQTKLNEEKVQNKSKIAPVSSVDETNNLKNLKMNPKVTLKPVEAEVKIDSSLSKDKPKNTSTQALETERPGSEHKMETISLKDEFNTNKSKEQLNQSNLHPKSEKEKSEIISASTYKPNTNINNASVKNLKINQPVIKTEQIQNQDQTVVTNKVSSTKLNESKSIDSITKIKTRSTENVMEIKSATTASSTSTVQNVIPLTASVPLKPSQSKKTSNNSPTPLTSILSKNLQDIARKNGILKSQTQKGKSEPINNHIFSYPELTGTSKPQSEQPKLIVDKSLPNRFNVERQNTKQIPQKIETIANENPKIETSTVKLEPKLKAPTTSQSKPELLKALSPLERAYNKIDKKLEEIQKEIELGDLKTATTSKSSIADPKSLKEVRENFKATKEETTIAKSSESSSVKELLNVDKTLNPKMDDENIIRKTYIPFSYHVTSPKEEPKVSQNKPKLESNATKSESPFLNLNFLKNYMKEKPKTVDSTKVKSDSILKQVTNMIKEELFTYQEVPKETGKKTLKLAEESLASQPTFDGNKPIKPGTIYNQVKNMLKEDLTNKTKSGPQFSIPNSVIPGATAKIQSEVTPLILNENNKKKTEDVTNSKMELEKSEQLVNKSEPKDDLTFKMNQEPISKAKRPAVAFAEPSVVPESVIVTETPPTPSKQSLNLADAKNAKKQIVPSIDKVQDVDQGKKAEINSDTYSDIKRFNKDVAESTNVDKPTLTSKSVVNKSNSEESNTIKLSSPLKPINATKPLEKEINKSKIDEEELYKILGISNDKSSRKEFKELPKPAESVMDRLRNYFEKSSPKLDPPKIIGASTTVTTNSDTSKFNEIEPLQAVKNKVEETKSDIQSQQSKVLNDSNAINFETVKNEETITSENIQKIASEPTEGYEAAKETQSDKFKNFIRTDSNNNSPYHMIKPLSLLEHLTNMNTEQVKIDHHMKLLSDSRSNSISNIDLKSKSENSPRIQSPLLQAIEKDDVLMTPNPEVVAKKTVSGNEKKSDYKSKDKPPTKSSETPQKSNPAKTVMSENQVTAANEKTKEKKKDKVKEEEEEEENEDEIKKVLDKEMKKSDKQLNNSVLSKDSNDKSPETKIETKSPDSDETTIAPTKDTFRKDSVKPLDDNRSEPSHIIESPGPSILDEETDIDPNKISNTKNEKSDEPPVTHLSPLNPAIFETEILKPSSNNSKLPGSPNNIVSSQPRTPEPHIALKIKPVDFSQQNQKFVRPSKPLIKQLNNVAKVNRNISSSVLEDFKIEMDRYNSAEATPEDKNKITLKIKYLTKIEPSESGGTHSESLTDSSKTKKIEDLDKKPK